jgi:hypothetical protein
VGRGRARQPLDEAELVDHDAEDRKERQPGEDRR